MFRFVHRSATNNKVMPRCRLLTACGLVLLAAASPKPSRHASRTSPALSRPCTDLIDGMMYVEPTNRLQVDHVLASPWMTGKTVAGSATGPVYRAGGDLIQVLGLSHGRAWKPLVPCRHCISTTFPRLCASRALVVSTPFHDLTPVSVL